MPRQTSVRTLRVFGYSGREDVRGRNEPGRYERLTEAPMARYLKRGMDASAIKAADAKVRETVENILAEVEARRDAAVRELSQKFDNWSPPSFQLAAPEIERAISRL